MQVPKKCGVYPEHVQASSKSTHFTDSQADSLHQTYCGTTHPDRTTAGGDHNSQEDAKEIRQICVPWLALGDSIVPTGCQNVTNYDRSSKKLSKQTILCHYHMGVGRS
jgi:hypothetical protein